MTVVNIVTGSKYRLIILIVVLLISACGSTEDKLIGLWQAEGLSYVLEFYDDGTFSQYKNKDKLNHPLLHGRWTLLDDGRLKITASSREVMVNTVEFDGDIMTLTEQGLRPNRYIKL